MTIKKLYYSKSLSVRSFNVCNNNKIKDLNALRNHYLKYSTFLNLRNCGVKSNEELISLIQNKNDFNISSNVINDGVKKEENIISIITKTTRTQREIINSFIEINSNKLSNRGINAINSYLNYDLKIRNLAERILGNDEFNYLDIKNIGVKTAEEIKYFINSVKEFIQKVSKVENETDLVILRNKFFIEKSFSINSIPDEILESQSLFKLVDFLINENGIFEIKENIIFQKSLKIYENQIMLTSEEIGKQINISKERIRQLKKIVLENLSEKLKFVNNLDDDLYQKYGIEKNQYFIFINNDLNNRINSLNNTNFSAEFNTYLIYVYLSPKFEILGEVEDILQSKHFKSKDHYNWRNFYLIKKELYKIFDLNHFAFDVHNRNIARNEITYSLNFKSYLRNFIKNEDISMLSIVFQIAERIVNEEFDIIIDLNDNIIFKKNTLKQVTEYAIEALEKLGVPSKIKEIYDLIAAVDSEITKSQEALRGNLQRTPEIIYFGRSSTYGLKKWEKEKEGIKGGTIKDIILEYLEDKKEPIHVLEVINEVHKYREKTNAKNIITNLKLDPQKKFIIFNQSFIGLTSKKYNSNLSSLPKFLGKKITYYINQSKCTDRIKLEEYFSNKLKISKKNMNYIIDYLIEQQFIFMNGKKNE
jgi:hypothetical protein